MSLSLAAACDCAKSISKPWKAESHRISTSRESCSTSTALPAALISRPPGPLGGLRDTLWLESNLTAHEISRCSSGKIADRTGGSAAGLCRSCATSVRKELHPSNRVLSFQIDRTHSLSDERRGDRCGQGVSRHWPKIATGKCGWLVPNASTRDRQLPDLRRPAIWLPHSLLRRCRRTNRAPRSP